MGWTWGWTPPFPGRVDNPLTSTTRRRRITGDLETLAAACPLTPSGASAASILRSRRGRLSACALHLVADQSLPIRATSTMAWATAMKRLWLAVAPRVNNLVAGVFGLKTRIVAAAASIALLVGCSPGGALQPLPKFALINQSGHTIRAEDLRGRAAIISFLFTNCQDTCPVVTARLAQAQAEVRAAGLSSSVRFVSITVDPTTDTPESFEVRRAVPRGYHELGFPYRRTRRGRPGRACDEGLHGERSRHQALRSHALRQRPWKSRSGPPASISSPPISSGGFAGFLQIRSQRRDDAGPSRNATKTSEAK